MPNPIARCITVAGSLPAGIILARLVYWLPKSKIKDAAGKTWVAFSRARWLEETSLSADQYKKGLAQLGKHELVEVKVQLVKGKMTPFVTLTEKGHWCVSAPRSVLIGTNGWCVSAPTIYTTCISEKKDSEGNIVSSVSPHAPKKSGKSSGPGKVGTMIRLPSKAKRLGVNAGASEAKPTSVLDVASAVKAKKLLHKPDSVTGLKFLWMQLLSEHHGLVSTNLTSKQLGMLKHFLNKCPAGTAEKAMTVAVSDWVTFAKTVEQQAGIKTSPSLPKIEFLLTHAGVAVNLIPTSPKSKPSKQEADTGMIADQGLQLISQSPKAPKPAADEVASLDDLLKILGGD